MFHVFPTLRQRRAQAWAVRRSELGSPARARHGRRRGPPGEEFSPLMSAEMR
jgi:hypothetical protein